MKIGDSASFEKTISESDVYQFAGITGDFNPLHVNKTEAEKSVFGERVVHGMLAGSLLSTVIGMYMPGKGTIYMEQNCKFIAPIKIGDTLKATVICEEILNLTKGIVRLKNEISNQDGRTVITGYSVVMVPKGLLEESEGC